MEILNYLKTKSWKELTQELGIVTAFHPTLPLVICNYHQIDSPKTHPVVRECRALVLNSNTKEIVARGFFRFFNWGEVADEMKLFNFNNFYTTEKVDGSYVCLFYFDKQWFAITRGSFAQDKLRGSEFTWQELFLKALNVSTLNDLNLDPALTYVCEFVSPFNKVVRQYHKFAIYLLSVFDKERELRYDEIKKIDNFLYPERYVFKNVEEIKLFLQEKSNSDPTFEGVVICDNNFRRYKLKSLTYLSLHRLKGENNCFSVKNLLPFILLGNQEEILTYFPEVKDYYMECKEKVDIAYNELKELWKINWKIDNQKEFALTVVGKTVFTGILFNIRKKWGNKQTEEILRNEWQNSADLIRKVIFHEN